MLAKNILIDDFARGWACSNWITNSEGKRHPWSPQTCRSWPTSSDANTATMDVLGNFQEYQKHKHVAVKWRLEVSVLQNLVSKPLRTIAPVMQLLASSCQKGKRAMLLNASGLFSQSFLGRPGIELKLYVCLLVISKASAPRILTSARSGFDKMEHETHERCVYDLVRISPLAFLRRLSCLKPFCHPQDKTS